MLQILRISGSCSWTYKFKGDLFSKLPSFGFESLLNADNFAIRYAEVISSLLQKVLQRMQFTTNEAELAEIDTTTKNEDVGCLLLLIVDYSSNSLGRDGHGAFHEVFFGHHFSCSRNCSRSGAPNSGTEKKKKDK
jgi:hypothetical protein